MKYSCHKVPNDVEKYTTYRITELSSLIIIIIIKNVTSLNASFVISLKESFSNFLTNLIFVAK